MKYESFNIDVLKVADYILCKASPDIGDVITNLKLQKLLYYCQGFILAITGKTLFKDDIIAWEHGPIVKRVYDKYKDNKSSGILPSRKGLAYYKELKKDGISDIIDDVWNVYGQFSAWRLRDMTHEEPPWRKTKKNEVISLDLLHDYFSTRIIDGKEQN